MSVLAVAVVLVGLLGVVNLLLTVRILRTMRSTPPPPPRIVGPFEANTTQGAAVGKALLTGTTLVAVVSPDCHVCEERLPELVARAARHDRDQVLAVVVGEDGESAGHVARLEPVAHVVREDVGGPVARALEVPGFPWFALLGADGTVRASGADLGVLDTPV
jgi:hypothetical protein